METNTEKELELLKKENKKLKKKLKKAKKKSESSSSWDFHWDGRGDYEEARRCFYGDFG